MPGFDRSALLTFKVGVELSLYDGLPVRRRQPLSADFTLSTDWKSFVLSQEIMPALQTRTSSIFFPPLTMGTGRPSGVR